MSKKTQANKKLKRAGEAKPGNARERMHAEMAQTTSRNSRVRVVVIAAVVIALLVGIGIGVQYFLATRDVQAQNTTVGGIPEVKQTLTAEKPLTWGSGAGTLRVYSDFNCPHCITFEKSYGSVLDEAVKSGKWKVELYPMAFVAQSSAAVANGFACAAAEGYGYAYQRAAFANSGRDWNNDQLISIASQVSGSEASNSFKSCVQRGTYRDVLAKNTDYAFKQAKVPGTPYVQVNGEALDVSTLTVDSFRQKLGLSGSGSQPATP